MALAFGLGYGEVWNNKARKKLPALWIPWMNRQITAIQYRFLGIGKDDNSADRFGQKKGGKRYLFGIQHCMDAEPGQLQTLILVEGELNAISILQRVYGVYACDVVSFGPQNNLNNTDVTKVASALARRYQRVIVWADESESAQAAIGAIPNAIPVRSPKGMDANDLLKRGHLDGLLYRLLHSPRQSSLAEEPSTLVGQVVSAQRYYELQQETAAIGWTLLGLRHGAITDGYCDEWKITKAVAP